MHEVVILQEKIIFINKLYLWIRLIEARILTDLEQSEEVVDGSEVRNKGVFS